MENEQAQIAGYYFAGQDAEQAKVLQLYDVSQPSNTGSKDFLAMALSKLAMDKRESFFRILQRAEQELEKEFKKCNVHSSHTTAQKDELTPLDLMIRNAIDLLKSTPYEELANDYTSPDLIKLYKFAFELCLTNEAGSMIKNFIEFQ
jgi:hypothetical protein